MIQKFDQIPEGEFALVPQNEYMNFAHSIADHWSEVQFADNREEIRFQSIQKWAYASEENQRSFPEFIQHVSFSEVS
jgi:hypothetical protein